MGNLLDRTALLKKEELKKEKVVLNDSGDYVFVRQMTAHEKNQWEMSQLRKTGTGKTASFDVVLDEYRAKLAVVTVCDEEGKLLFGKDDYTLLSQNMSAATLEKIVDVAQALNAINEQDKEEMLKNSKTDQSDDSSSN